MDGSGGGRRSPVGRSKAVNGRRQPAVPADGGNGGKAQRAAGMVDPAGGGRVAATAGRRVGPAGYKRGRW
ncbi:hypothetical protein MCNS_02020 [Mycobacterium conspicuum]|uniref:Uncharacterized protein n=1 Tax=Mycobacterium conspicuum TaxID=44010 RepID=A0A7I7Y655_9MYCO|nr:hypothetical protein MCNS_02020 [Mycobacterium conspicuum]